MSGAVVDCNYFLKESEDMDSQNSQSARDGNDPMDREVGRDSCDWSVSPMTFLLVSNRRLCAKTQPPKLQRVLHKLGFVYVAQAVGGGAVGRCSKSGTQRHIAIHVYQL